MTQLNISLPPNTGNVDFDNWQNQTTQYLRDYLGHYEYCTFAEDYGFLPSATGSANSSALATAIATGTKYLVVRTPGNFTLDNTSPVLLSTNDMKFELCNGVNILPTVNTSKVFYITGKNVTFEGGTITGDGNYVNTGSSTGRPISFIEVYNGVSPVSVQNVIIRNVKMVNPNNMGITLYRTVGVLIEDCNFISAYADSYVDRASMVYVYSSASVLIDSNLMNGASHGIVGGGASAYSFDDFAGETDFNTRDVFVSNNRVFNYIDHGIYFSNECNRISIQENSVSSTVSGSSSGIKLFGSGVVSGNIVTSLNGGFDGRCSNNLIFNNNRIYVTGTGSSVSAFEIEGSGDWDINIENIVISDNLFVSGNVLGITKGIYIYGLKRVSDGSQNLLKNISISGNVFSGKIGGHTSGTENAVISMFQENHNTAASSVYGQNITIVNNTAYCEPITGPNYNCKYFAILSAEAGHANFDNVVIKGNSAFNIVSHFGYLGIRNGIVTDNFVKPQTGNGAVIEVTKTDTPSGLNYFGTIHGGTWTVFAAVDTSEIDSFEKRQYNGSLGLDTTYLAYRPFRHLVLNPTDTRAITLVTAAGYVFPNGMLVTVHNLSSSKTLTFELSPGGSTSTIAISSSKTFMCTGSNTFIETN